jgi:hypothetical protein
MYQPPLRGQSILAGKRVLLIDSHKPTRDVRAAILQSYGVEVQAAESVLTARCLWRPKRYNWILMNVRRCVPEEALAFYQELTDSASRERFAFLVGPPRYLSRTWPNESAIVESGTLQWDAIVQQFLATGSGTAA